MVVLSYAQNHSSHPPLPPNSPPPPISLHPLPSSPELHVPLRVSQAHEACTFTVSQDLSGWVTLVKVCR